MLTDQEAYEKLLPIVNAIPAIDIRHPDMPVDRAVHEAEVMAAATIKQIERFSAIGLSDQIGSDLQECAGALRLADAYWMASWGEQKEGMKAWAEQSPLGYNLRDEVLAAMRYAYRDRTSLQQQIKRIAEGSTQTDLIQDLKDIFALGTRNSEPLTAINFDLAKLGTCSELADTLGTLKGFANVEEKVHETKVLRDRYFTYMRSVMGEIRDAAEYLFRNDEEQMQLFYSDYRRATRGKKEEPVIAG
jgi:hypothetical protein